MDVLSVIIPVEDSAEHLQEAIESVFPQLSFSKEIVVIDNCSSAETIKAEEKLLNKYPIFKLIKLSKKVSQSELLKKGLDISTGSYVLFFKSSSILYPDSLSKVRQFLNEYDVVQFSYSEGEKFISQREAQKVRAPVRRGQLIAASAANTIYNKIFKSSIIKSLNFKDCKDFERASLAELWVLNEPKGFCIDYPLFYSKKEKESKYTKEDLEKDLSVWKTLRNSFIFYKKTPWKCDKIISELKIKYEQEKK